MAGLDSTSLQDIRRRAGSSRDRKFKYATEIKRKLEQQTDNWQFDQLGMHYLAYVATVALMYAYKETNNEQCQSSIFQGCPASCICETNMNAFAPKKICFTFIRGNNIDRSTAKATCPDDFCHRNRETAKATPTEGI